MNFAKHLRSLLEYPLVALHLLHPASTSLVLLIDHVLLLYSFLMRPLFESHIVLHLVLLLYSYHDFHLPLLHSFRFILLYISLDDVLLGCKVLKHLFSFIEFNELHLNLVDLFECLVYI